MQPCGQGLSNMKRTIAALLIFGFTPASHAVVIDLCMMTCQEFLATDKDEIRIIWAWLDGYYKDEQDLPIMDTNTMVDNLKKLSEYCAANPTASLPRPTSCSGSDWAGSEKLDTGSTCLRSITPHSSKTPMPDSESRKGGVFCVAECGVAVLKLAGESPVLLGRSRSASTLR
jgi:acid stress chaperone HdeB